MKNLRKRMSVLLAFLLVIVFVPVFSLPVSAASYTIKTNFFGELNDALNDPLYDEIIVPSGITIADPGNHTITIPAGKTLTIEVGGRLSFPMGTANYINNGTINVFGRLETSNSVTNNGVINNVGFFEAGIFKNNGTFTGSGGIGPWDFTIQGSNSTQYAITFDENDASGSTDTVSLYAANMGVMMPADPTRAGYTFRSWNKVADGSGTTFDSATSLSVFGTTSPVTATVYAQWGSPKCDITAFTLPNQVGAATINGTNVGVTVPYGTDVTALSPTIAVSDGGTVSPTSGTEADFTSSVVYTVTAEDGVATQTYTVTVTIGAQVTYAVAVTKGTGGGSYPQGATVNITADTPPAGQVFDKWISSDVTFANETAETTSFTMPANAVSVTATYKASPPTPLTKHTITLGASGDGVVSGGGNFDENTTITVTATADAGNSFVNWTENGVEVSDSASYRFVVTSARTLVANFKADDVPTPPTPSYGGRSSSSGGSSKADVSSMVQTGKTLTKADATKLFKAALAVKPEGQATLSFIARNYTKVDKSVLAELAALAKKNGVTLTVHFDTVVGKAVTYRISVNPAAVTTNLDLTAKIVGGKITLPKFNPPVEVAVKMPAGITIGNLKVTQNGKEITNAKPWLDKNGYLHFTTTGGEIVLGK